MGTAKWLGTFQIIPSFESYFLMRDSLGIENDFVHSSASSRRYRTNEVFDLSLRVFVLANEFVLGMNFSVDFNFAGFFNELRFLECASDYVGFHISACSFQCSDNFANCCRPVVPQPCDNPVCLYAILATLFSPTSSHGCVF